MKSIFSVLTMTFLSFTQCFAQELNGTWLGKLTQDTTSFEFELILKSSGYNKYQILSTVKIDKEYGKIIGSAYYSNGSLIFTEEKIVEGNNKINQWCIKSGNLEYFKKLKKENLIGNWKGNCIPGKISLSKISSKTKSKYFFENKKSNFKSEAEKVNRILEKYNSPYIPGLTVAVIKGEEVIYKSCFGASNLEFQTLITSETKFNIASVSKQFTAFAILLLQEEGKININDDIRQYIPEVPDFGKTITIKHLLYHTSGIRSGISSLVLRGWESGDVFTKEDFLKFIEKQKSLNFSPGDKYCYSNSGYTLLAEIVSRVSSQSFDEFTQQRIFKPLKMTNSLFKERYNQIIPNSSSSYLQSDVGYNPWIINDETVGNTNLYTSQSDMIIWLKNFQNPTVGSEELLKKMTTRNILNNGDTSLLGMGLFVDEHKGLKRISHSGNQGGYRAKTTTFPTVDLSIIVLSNNSSVNTNEITSDIASIYLNELLVNDTLKDKPNFPTISQELDFSPYQICGLYGIKDKPGFEVEVFLTDTIINLKMNFINQHLHIGNSKGNQYELIENPDVKFVFSNQVNGVPQKLTKLEAGFENNWYRIEKEDLSKTDLKEFLGTFYSEELQTTYSFKILGEQLILDHFELNSHVFTQTGLNTFQGDAWFLNQLEFERDNDNTVIGFKISNLRSQNVYFRKM